MDATTFNDLTDIYEALIDWPKRLAHEEGFYRRLFARVGAKRVLDAACGTGRHAAMFHQWGLSVEAADLSPNMLAKARGNFGQPEGLTWVERGFDQPVTPPASFDVALCVGHSLALAPDVDTAARAIKELLAAVRPGGVVVLHTLNLWALPDGPCVWQKCVRATLPDGDALVIKGVHRKGNEGYVELIAVNLAGKPVPQTQAVRFLGLEAEMLQRLAQEAGASWTSVVGGYNDEPYERAKSVDLIVLAEKAEG